MWLTRTNLLFVVQKESSEQARAPHCQRSSYFRMCMKKYITVIICVRFIFAEKKSFLQKLLSLPVSKNTSCISPKPSSKAWLAQTSTGQTNPNHRVQNVPVHHPIHPTTPLITPKLLGNEKHVPEGHQLMSSAGACRQTTWLDANRRDTAEQLQALDKDLAASRVILYRGYPASCVSKLILKEDLQRRRLKMKIHGSTGY